MLSGGPCSEHNRPRVYIAAPIFTPAQLESVGAVVDVVHSCGYVSYSPHRDGIMLAASDPPEKRDEVFHSNLKAIRQSDVLIAILDTKDTGTIWELGVATAAGIPIIAVTVAVNRMNVMLERGVVAHCINLHDLSSVMTWMRQYVAYGAKQTGELRNGWIMTLERFKMLYSYSGATQ